MSIVSASHASAKVEIRSLAQWVDALQAVGCSAYIAGNPQCLIDSLASLHNAKPNQLSFLSSSRHQNSLKACQAGAIIVSESDLIQLDRNAHTWVVTAHPYLYYAKAAQWWQQQNRPTRVAFIHPSAVVASSAILHPSVLIGPFVTIEEGVVIEADVDIGAGAFIGPGCRIGQGSHLYPRATLVENVHLGQRVIVHSGAVLGADGFGFAKSPVAAHWEKIPQLGSVIIGDDVEIGANTCVDRGALDATRIENGAKLDNLIQVGHNVVIGEHTAIAGCTGIAGSAHIGARCTLGGGANILGHLTICDDVDISACTTVLSSIDQPGRYSGFFPFMPHRQWEQNTAVLRRLAQWRRDVQRRLRADTDLTPDADKA